VRLDPLNPAAHFHLGFNRLWEGKFGRAREVLQKLNREFPDDPTITFAYGLSLAYLGEGNQAGAVFGELAREQPGTMFAEIGLSLKYGFEGKKSEAMSCLDATSLMPSRHDFQYACWLAECYALIDERETALDWLERDVELGMINYPYLNEYDPFLAKLRGEPRFQQLMVRVKDEWERFEA
jgi:tetratricopeptide (TPR) repeat protein